MNDANSVVLRTNEKSTEQDGLIWKTIAVEGDYQTASVNNRKINSPMRFTSSGQSIPEQNIYSLQDIKQSFDEGAFNRVAIPLDHRNKVHENTGWVKEVKLATDTRGRACLKAALDIKDESIKDKILKGTIADVSMGLRARYKRNKDGKDYPVALNHICLTNVPFLSDLDDFELSNNFSDEEEKVDVYYFDDNDVSPLVVEKEPEVEPVVPEPTQEDTFNIVEMTYSLISQFKNDFPNIADVKVEGAINNVALITYKTDNKDYSWAVPFEVTDINEGKNKLFTYSKISFDTINTIEDKEEIPQETHEVQTPRELTLKEQLQMAQDKRLQKVSLSDHTTGDIHQMDELNFSELGLEGEALAVVKKALADRDAEIAKNAKSKRQAEVENKIVHLSDELGLKEYPGLLTYIKDIYNSDDNQISAVVNFSDEDTEKGLTASEILDGLIERLPRDKEGKINLSEQALEVSAGKKPANDTADENLTAAQVSESVLNDLAELGITINEG